MEERPCVITKRKDQICMGMVVGSRGKDKLIEMVNLDDES
jgi:hypothetical protein